MIKQVDITNLKKEIIRYMSTGYDGDKKVCIEILNCIDRNTNKEENLQLPLCCKTECKADCKYMIWLDINSPTYCTRGRTPAGGRTMNQYIITEEQLQRVTGRYTPQELRELVNEVRSHPYQSDRDTVLDELIVWREKAYHTVPGNYVGLWREEEKHLKELRQQAGEP
jgi:hypothetical protein